MLISTEVVVMTSKIIFSKISIGEIDLAIADYSKALEIDNKNNKLS